jgi:hypothetical protein
VTRLRLEVTDEHGTTAFVIDPPPLSLLDWGAVDALIEAAAAGLAAVPGIGSREHAREILLAAAIRQAADTEAYERVAAQRGLLPL